MNAQIPKHEKKFWIGRLLVVFALLTSSGVQAAIEYAQPIWLWCTVLLPPCIYPTDRDGAQARINIANAEAQGHYALSIVSSDGNGAVTVLYDFHSYNFQDIWKITKWATCPTPKYFPISHFQFDYESEICVRWVPDTRTITLTGGTEIEPTNGSDIKTLPFIATVKDENGQPTTSPVDVKISLKVEATSGGHDHGNSDRPRGGIAGVEKCNSDDTCWTGQTDGNGQVVFNFNSPEASGTHSISATCDGCSNTDTKSVDVKVNGLIPLLDSVYYSLTEDGSTKVIGDNGNHSGNHYLTSTSSTNIWKIARDFYEYQIHKGVKKPTLLHLNDASLKWGGKFDVSGKWIGYHYAHDRGNAIDVRANTSAGYIPEANFSDFENLSDGIGADAQLHCSATRDPSIDNCAGDENRHYHVILN